jgi:hypothetical protein
MGNWVFAKQQIHGIDKNPKADRILVSQWIIYSNNDINKNIGQNSWLNAPINYLPIEE